MNYLQKEKNYMEKEMKTILDKQKLKKPLKENLVEKVN
jgi:hypothetical protein